MKNFHASTLGKASLATLAFSAMTGAFAQQSYDLTILHNNDAESQLFGAPSDDNYGGISRFANLISDLKTNTYSANGVLAITSGDNFLAGPEFQASLNTSDGDSSRRFFDAYAIAQVGYDALIIGNHEFDFGDNVLAEFIDDAQTGGSPLPFLSANLSFTGGELQTRSNNGLIKGSELFSVNFPGVGTRQVGVIGAVTTGLRTISSPSNDVVIQDLANTQNSINNAATSLRNNGADVVILSSHFQSFSNDSALISGLSGIDAVVGGGSGTNLADADGPVGGFVPGDSSEGDYPTVGTFTDANSNVIPYVTTSGDYKYIGGLTLTIDEDINGNVTGVSVNTAETDTYAVVSDTIDPVNGVSDTNTTIDNIIAPVQTFVDGLAADVIANNQVNLDGRRSEVRSTFTNYGRLLADALLDAASDGGALTGTADFEIGLQNGGGMRNDSIITPGDYTALDTFDVAAFANFVRVVQGVTLNEFLDLLATAYGGLDDLDDTSGNFAQLDSSVELVNFNTDTNTVTDLIIDGVVIVANGVLLLDGETTTFDIASIDFLTNGGGGYFDGGAESVVVLINGNAITYQQALERFTEEELAGMISGAYEDTENGKFVLIVPEPSALGGLFGLAALLVARRRRA